MSAHSEQEIRFSNDEVVSWVTGFAASVADSSSSEFIEAFQEYGSADRLGLMATMMVSEGSEMISEGLRRLSVMQRVNLRPQLNTIAKYFDWFEHTYQARMNRKLNMQMSRLIAPLLDMDEHWWRVNMVVNFREAREAAQADAVLFDMFCIHFPSPVVKILETFAGLFPNRYTKKEHTEQDDEILPEETRTALNARVQRMR